MKIFLAFSSFLVMVLLINPIQSQPGSLDLTFGTDGTVMSPITEHRELGYGMVVQADGKIVLAGMQEIISSSDFAVARYNADGSPDNAFGTNGVTLIDGGTDSDAAWCMALQDDGKIVLGGSVYNQFTTVDDFAAVRLNTDGSPDNTFGGGDGIVITDIGGFWDNAYGIAIQDDGKILLGGDGYNIDKRNICIVRYLVDGSLDPSFGSGGIALHSVGSVSDHTKAIAVQADGKILTAGYFDDGVDDQSCLTRFNADGTVDITFGNNGSATLDIGGNEDRFFAVCMQPDGKIIAGGFSMNASLEIDALFVRYLTDGSLDNSFGGGSGIILHSFNSNGTVQDMMLQADGKILAAIESFAFGLVRLLEDGQRDNTFGDNGIVSTTIGNYCSAVSVGLYDDGKAVLGGHAFDGTSYNFALARYHLEGSGLISEPNNTFHEVSIYPNPVMNNEIQLSYALQENEKVSIELLTINGQLVEQLLDNDSQKAGLHYKTLQLPGNLTPGIYLLRLKSSQGSKAIRLNIK
jgi:uncharacterized delta-60 repeat protein